MEILVPVACGVIGVVTVVMFCTKPKFRRRFFGWLGIERPIEEKLRDRRKKRRELLKKNTKSPNDHDSDLSSSVSMEMIALDMDAWNERMSGGNEEHLL